MEELAEINQTGVPLETKRSTEINECAEIKLLV